MNISNRDCNFPSKLLFVKLHSNNFVGEALVEETVDLGSSGQLQGIDSG